MNVGSGACSNFDQTLLFKSCVKAIKIINKAKGVTLPHTNTIPTTPTPSSLFCSRVKDAANNIVAINDLLKLHRKQYLKDLEQSLSHYEHQYVNTLRIIEENICSLESELANEHQQDSGNASEYQKALVSVVRMKL